MYSQKSLWKGNAQKWTKVMDEGLDDFRRSCLDPYLDALLVQHSSGIFLDLGCGEGKVARTIAKGGCQVVGVDLAYDFTRTAQERLAEGFFVQGDVLSLPFCEGAFDGAVSKLTSVNVPDYLQFLRETERILRPGGILIDVVTHPCFASFQGDPIHPNIYLKMHKKRIQLNKKGVKLKVVNYHRSLSDYFDCFAKTSFIVKNIFEPPTTKNLTRSKQWKNSKIKGPPFLIFVLQRSTV